MGTAHFRCATLLWIIPDGTRTHESHLYSFGGIKHWKVIWWTKTLKSQQLTEDGFDSSISGLWAQHTFAAPLSFVVLCYWLKLPNPGSIHLIIDTRLLANTGCGSLPWFQMCTPTSRIWAEILMFAEEVDPDVKLQFILWYKTHI